MTFRAYGQEYSLQFAGQPLSEALLISSRNFGFEVAFDAQKLRDIHVNREVKGATVEEFVNDLLRGTRFSYQLKYGSYLIVDRVLKKADDPRSSRILEGTVTDYATGERLPYATVMIEAQEKYLYASLDGCFEVKDLLSGPQVIHISYVGYHTLDTTVVYSEHENSFTFQLMPESSIIDSVGITGRRSDQVQPGNNIDFAVSLRPSALTDLPEYSGAGVFKSLQLLPGIGQSEDISELSIRGGSADQNLVLLDGLTLYNLSHFFGTFSAINPNIVKNIRVLKGGFDSRYGERISGIVDIAGKSGNMEKPLVYGNLNRLSGDVAVELPVGEKLSLLTAGRYSLAAADRYFMGSNDIQTGIGLKDTPAGPVVAVADPSFHFHDLNAKVNFAPNKGEQVSLSLFQSRDKYNSSTKGSNDMLNIHSNDTSSWNNYGLSLAWAKEWNGKLNTAFQAGVSGYRNRSGNLTVIEPLVPEQLEGSGNVQQAVRSSSLTVNDLSDKFLSGGVTLRTAPAHRLDFGFLLRHQDVFMQRLSENPSGLLETDQSASTASIYLQDQITHFTRLVVKPGFRMSYFSNSHQGYFEPRIAILYRITDEMSVRLAGGRYNQFISQVELQNETGYNRNSWILADDSVHAALQANHFVLGATYAFRRFTLDAELYYKTYTGAQDYLTQGDLYIEAGYKHMLPVRPFSYTEDPKFTGGQIPAANPGGSGGTETAMVANETGGQFVNGTGRAYGLDLFLQYRSTRFSSWLSYSWGRSTRRFPAINHGSEIPSPEDRTHQVSWTNLFMLGRWNVSLENSYSTGKPYVLSSENLQGLQETREYRRLPDYFRTDVSFNYGFQIRGLSLKAGISAYNLLNSRNYYDVNIRKIRYGEETFTETSYIPLRGFTWNAFLQFAF